MGAAFPELKKNPQHVIELIKDEEVSFSKTLDRGIELHNLAMSDAGDRLVQRARLEPEIKTALEKGGVLQPSRIGEGSRFVPQVTWSHLPSFARPIISGDDAFRLHDTYGFPIDLTRIMAEERGLDVDIERYEQLMAEARVRSRSTSDEVTVRDEIISITTRRKFAPSEFVGYDTLVANAHLLECFEHTTALISKNFEDLAVGDKAVLVFDISPFYAESGGQIGDKGTIRSSRGTNFLVEETFKIGSTHFHYGHVQNRSENVSKSIDQANANFALEVSREYRLPTMKNHTGTHLANWALRQTLGDGVQQKGSLVDPEKLRFDFSHSKSLTDDELARVETLVNEAIAKKLPVYAQEAPQEAALKINGLRAVFGEKYPPLVRVVSIGAPVEQLLSDPNNPKWREFSVEFCGGTHLPSSDQIGNFSITAEESVSKGIRRIVALTGEAAAAVESAATRVEGLISRQIPDAELASVIAELQTSLASPLPLRAKRRAQATLTELQSRQRTLEKAARAQPGGGGVDAVKIAGELLAKADSLGSGKLIIGQIAGASDDQLRSAIDSLRKKSPSHAILLASSDDQKVTFVAAVSDDLVAKGLKAGDWIKQTAVIAGGGGGGRPQMAQGSGKDPSKITAALDAARNFALKFA
jgi:alanyl-tRNA synthetase